VAYKDPEKLRAWREANRERLLAGKRAWYLANRERVLAEAKLRVRTPRVYDPAKYKAYYEKNRERMIAKARAWHEKNREERASYGKARYLQLWEDPAWRADNVARAKAWMVDHRDKYRENMRRAKVRRKGRLSGSIIEEFSQAQLDKRIRLLGSQCVYCGGPFQHLDHLVPVAAGGRHALWNLAPSCRACNTSKADSDPLTWVERRAINKTAIVVVERAIRKHMRNRNAA
jgi:5-methylcytosine-specific restriction endonuclease McrA